MTTGRSAPLFFMPMFKNILVLSLLIVGISLNARTDLAWLETFDPQPPAFRDVDYSIVELGAQPDDIVATSEAIRSAIQECSTQGGGRVIIPAGKWLTGPIKLLDNVNLHLEEGAYLEFSDRFEDYLPVVLIQRGGYLCYNYSPPIYARDATNIAITGKGTIDGNGQVWWPWKQNQPGMVRLFEMGNEKVPIKERIFGTPEDGVRPPFVQFIHCKNILLDGPRFIDGPSWMIHPVYSENIIIRNIEVISLGPNNDGIDIDGCRNVLIENCFLDTGDDAICLKSGRGVDVLEPDLPTENVVVRNSRVQQGNGGFVIGSEMSSSVRNVLVENCEFDDTDRGIRLKTRPGRGGVVENITIRNISMKNIRHEAIRLTLNYNMEPLERGDAAQQLMGLALPIVRNLFIENVYSESARKSIEIVGLPGSLIQNLHLKNVHVRGHEKGTIEFVDDMIVENFTAEIAD